MYASKCILNSPQPVRAQSGQACQLRHICAGLEQLWIQEESRDEPVRGDRASMYERIMILKPQIMPEPDDCGVPEWNNLNASGHACRQCKVPEIKPHTKQYLNAIPETWSCLWQDLTRAGFHACSVGFGQLTLPRLPNGFSRLVLRSVLCCVHKPYDENDTGNVKMPKKRKKNPGVGIDFKRAKLKVGKKLPQAKNATDTNFKAQSISLPGQNAFSDDHTKVPVSDRNLTIKVCLHMLGFGEAAARLSRFLPRSRPSFSAHYIQSGVLLMLRLVSAGFALSSRALQ